MEEEAEEVIDAEPVDEERVQGDGESQHVYVTPTKQIKTLAMVKKWERSPAYRDYMGFVISLNETVKGRNNSDECQISSAVERIVAVLDELMSWIEALPPVDQPTRFGNKAFRDWYKLLEENCVRMCVSILTGEEELDQLTEAASEISRYFLEGFGNSTRIDYGTGHEMSFAAFLCCLCKLRVLKPTDYTAVVQKVFTRYLEVTRCLQQTYRMEPAGSQGVWGLDDFQFLPFLWGSAQLLDHQYLSPRDIPDADKALVNRSNYLLFGCIHFINQMKTGVFAEHSNQLWGISAVPYWSKVNSGLIKMYKAEVLAKFPIVQHFPFGSLLVLDS